MIAKCLLSAMHLGEHFKCIIHLICTDLRMGVIISFPFSRREIRSTLCNQLVALLNSRVVCIWKLSLQIHIPRWNRCVSE